MVWWNVRNFGKPSAKNSAYSDSRLAKIADILKPAEPDVLIIQEVWAQTRDTMPFTALFKLHGYLTKIGLDGLLYPSFGGNQSDGEGQYSMAVFYNTKKLIPLITRAKPDDLPKEFPVNEDATVYASKAIYNDKKKGIEFTRKPILSAFKTIAGDQQLNVYALHAKNPLEGRETTRLNNIRKGEIAQLMALASAASTPSTLTVMGGDMNGSLSFLKALMSNPLKYWNIGLADSTNTYNNTHLSQDAWSWGGTFPNYGILSPDQPLDNMVWLKTDLAQSSAIVPWVINPVTGSAPVYSISALPEGVTNTLGYFSGITAATQQKVLHYIKANGVPARLSEGNGNINTNRFAEDLYYLTDHLPVALDIILPTE